MFVLGIDAGGTKTVCQLADDSGAILGEARGPGANLQAAGELAVEKTLHTLMDEAMAGHAKNIDVTLFKDGSLDLVTMIRVMHHLPDPKTELKEINRVLSKDGIFILELANYAHARNRIKHIIRRQKLPTKPVDIRSNHNRREEEIAFVNHNPKTVIRQLDAAGFEVKKILSVSNLRSPGLKKILPKPIMLSVEAIMQSPFSRIYFGPSVFFLLKKKA